jgi:membrane protease YdiL (CAAX protease family)
MEKTKKEIFIFLVLLLILSGLSYILISQSKAPNVEDSPIALLLVYCPFLAAIITRLITGRNLKKIGWRFGKGKYLFVALLIPIIAGIIVYGFVWLTKLGYVNGNAKIGLGSNLSKSLDFLIFCVFGLLARSIGAFGEEVGWRGFLTPRLYKLTNITTTSIIIGIIWYVWHIPLLLMTNYGGDLTILKVLFSIIGLIAISFMLTWLRIKSGSLWIGVFYHASHNFFIQNVFDVLLIEKGGRNFFLTEMGIGLCITSIVIGILFWKLRFKLSPPAGYLIN